MKSKKFKASDLVLVSQAEPKNLAFIVKGATVWLNSGSPPMKVLGVRKGLAKVSCPGEILKIPTACLTPEPTPIKP